MAWTPIKLRKGGDVTFVGEAEGAGGGSQPRVLGPFPFAFDTPGVACLSFPIIAVDQEGGTFTIAGDHVDYFQNNLAQPETDTDYLVTGSTGNDGAYGPQNNVTLVDGNTVIPASGNPLPDPTPDGIITGGSWGAAFYTPTVGDVLLDAWLEVDTAWDCSGGALADIGTRTGSGAGLFSGLIAVALTRADDSSGATGGEGLLIGTQISDLVAAGAAESYRPAPLRFLAANPLYVWASANGSSGYFLPPDGTQGEANIYLVVATPASP